MKILITGSAGQLGSELNTLSREFNTNDFYFTNSKELDITNASKVENFIIENKIDCIINCAAFTAVDKSENEKEQAELINHFSVKSLALLSKKYNCKLIHISTDYVFDGEGHKPYFPDDLTSPVNFYGSTKLAGEQAMSTINPKGSIIIRTSWVYSSFGNNFVKTMLKLGSEKENLNVIYDQVGSPTYARDLAQFILESGISYEGDDVKVYHYTNEGVCSWYDLAKETLELSGLNCTVNPIPTSSYPTTAKRPHYSLMSKDSLKVDFNTEIPYWKDSLKKCLVLLNNK
ncbi:dTDP-4-dehydrorhamnose reductase [Leeuwenhoekiella sp. NPDC079379]|uniref:dTDP-4-dehydrorhamnose reductase n=1 Tax=Leeuwenhoekiella sp. NPDC079379 TaxID=3364122 RepID=UPI0037C629AC